MGPDKLKSSCWPPDKADSAHMRQTVSLITQEFVPCSAKQLSITSALQTIALRALSSVSPLLSEVAAAPANLSEHPTGSCFCCPAGPTPLPQSPEPCLAPVLHAAGHNVPSQELLRPRNASGAGRTVSASVGASQSGAEQQLGELPAPSAQPKWEKPRPQPRGRQAAACTGPPSSCMPAAVPGDELCPED